MFVAFSARKIRECRRGIIWFYSGDPLCFRIAFDFGFTKERMRVCVTGLHDVDEEFYCCC